MSEKLLDKWAVWIHAGNADVVEKTGGIQVNIREFTSPQHAARATRDAIEADRSTRCCICEAPATHGGHGVTDGQLVSFSWCAAHKGAGLDGHPAVLKS